MDSKEIYRGNFIFCRVKFGEFDMSIQTHELGSILCFYTACSGQELSKLKHFWIENVSRDRTISTTT